METLLTWVAEAVSDALGRRVSRIRRIRGREGGHTGAIRRIAELDDGSSAYVKVATTTALAERLRHEIEIYEQVQEPFMLTKLGEVDDGARVVLILENAETARWPPPWDTAGISAVTAMLDKLRQVAAPGWLVWLGGPEALGSASASWQQVLEDPSRLLTQGLVSASWLERSIEPLQAAERNSNVGGGSLVHLDVRSDNICFDRGQVKLVDWPGARLGHSYLDQHYWATTLYRETGTRHDELLTADAPGHLARLSGWYAGTLSSSVAGHLRAEQAQLLSDSLRSLLPWVCDLLDLEPPAAATRA
ncbi:MAG: hypothetical protein OES13_09130 [Acidimicrobiia bacterium]|nr:hypothetical protein [Acidimicrobiia bacterium]